MTIPFEDRDEYAPTQAARGCCLGVALASFMWALFVFGAWLLWWR